jgi:hypothetical protein
MNFFMTFILFQDIKNSHNGFLRTAIMIPLRECASGHLSFNSACDEEGK